MSWRCRSGETAADRYILRVSQVSTISEETQRAAERGLCLAPAAAADCPEERHATEVKISPGGDRITARFVGTADVSWVKERLTGITGLNLRPVSR